MKGQSPKHPYPPKCRDPYKPMDQGGNRPMARLFFVFDEDDLNRTPREGVVQRLIYHATAQEKCTLTSGLAVPAMDCATPDVKRKAMAGPPSNDSSSDTESDDEVECQPDCHVEAVEFAHAATGLRSAVHGVVSLTATPAACGHDLPAAANNVQFQVVKMIPPKNYVGYPFLSAPHCERAIEWQEVPDRRLILALQKSLLYTVELKERGLWQDGTDKPPEPFKVNARGTISLSKRDRDVDPQLEEIWWAVDAAFKESKRRGDKVVECDGEGLQMMLQSMVNEKDGRIEPERRGLVISNFTRNLLQKQHLAKNILVGELSKPLGCEDGSSVLSADLFVIIFDYRGIEIRWRVQDHEAMAVLLAVRNAAPQLMPGRGQPLVEQEDGCNVFRSSFANINHAYSALHEYATCMRRSDSAFKLCSIALSGDIGGRGVNYKPHGSHWGYLTDMFFQFDAFRTRQITTHGEYALQAVGRLCGLVTDEMLQQMQRTPPRLWASATCWKLLKTFGHSMSQWVDVLASKAVDECMQESLERAIEHNPDAFKELHRVLIEPTSGRADKKRKFLRTSRLHKPEDQLRKNLWGGSSAVPSPGPHRLPTPDQQARARELLQAVPPTPAQAQLSPAPQSEVEQLLELCTRAMPYVDHEGNAISEATHRNYCGYLKRLRREGLLTTLQDLNSITQEQLHSMLASGAADTTNSSGIRSYSLMCAVRFARTVLERMRTSVDLQ